MQPHERDNQNSCRPWRARSVASWLLQVRTTVWDYAPVQWWTCLQGIHVHRRCLSKTCCRKNSQLHTCPAVAVIRLRELWRRWNWRSFCCCCRRCHHRPDAGTDVEPDSRTAIVVEGAPSTRRQHQSWSASWDDCEVWPLTSSSPAPEAQRRRRRPAPPLPYAAAFS